MRQHVINCVHFCQMVKYATLVARDISINMALKTFTSKTIRTKVVKSYRKDLSCNLKVCWKAGKLTTLGAERRKGYRNSNIHAKPPDHMSKGHSRGNSWDRASQVMAQEERMYNITLHMVKTGWAEDIIIFEKLSVKGSRRWPHDTAQPHQEE